MRRVFRITMILILMVSAAGILSAQDRIQIELLGVDPDTQENRKYFSDLLRETAYQYRLLYGEDNEVSFGSSLRRPDYQVQLYASAGSVVVNMERRSDSTQAQALTFLGSWQDIDPRLLAQRLYYQKMSMSAFLPPEGSRPPLLIDKFTLEYFSFRDLSPSLYIYPANAAALPDGNTLIAASALGLVMDRDMRLVDVIGKDDVRQNRVSEYYDVASTPSGILYFRSGLGGYVNRVVPGAARAQRIPIPVRFPMDFTVLSDGSLILSDTAPPKVLRVADRRSSELDVARGALVSPSAMAAGPSGNLWLYNSGTGAVEIATPEGTPIRQILPLIDTSEQYLVRHILPSSDGTFLLASMNSLYRFSSAGEMLWKLDGIPGDPGGNYHVSFGMTFHEDTGEIIIPMSSLNYLLRFVDVDYLERNDLPPNPNLSVAPSARRFAEDPYDGDAAREMAEHHEANGAFEVAAYYWNQVLFSDPANRVAVQRLENIQVETLISQARILGNRVIDIIETIGPESARGDFQRAVAIYEELLSIRPGDSSIAGEKSRLEERFAIESAQPERERRPLDIQNASIPDIFPSLTQVYARREWGRITLSNPYDSPAENIEIEVYIPGYMDLPNLISMEEPIAAGESREVTLKPVFSERLLSLEEDILTQARVSLHFEIDSIVQNQGLSYQLTIHRKTALSWDDSAKLASFILPNEGNVQDFALTVSGGSDYRDLTPGQYSFDPRLFRAMRIIDALGARGIEYIEDPASPISVVLGQESAVDTVRFPRTTLLYQSGDCDDTTALLTSLLEAAGIRTAILTSPGHVFAAFESGEPEENRWLLESDDTAVIAHDGTLWIPVETTLLKEGFFAAWKDASTRVRTYAEEDLEFIPVYQARDLYPAMALPPVNLDILRPSPDQVGALLSESLESFTEVLFEDQVASLEREASRLSGRRKVRSLNNLGALYAAFARYDQAESALREAISLNNANVLGYIYLTNVLIEQGRYNEALELADQGLEQRPDSAYLLLGKAMAYFAAGRQSEARSLMERLEGVDAALANQYRYLASGGNDETGTRASAGGTLPRLTWPGEDDAER
jgi:tetratricopeptide (TPR) repeat protein